MHFWLAAILVLTILAVVLLCKFRSESMGVGDGTRHVTLHYTTWCGHCKNMRPVWDRVKLATKGSNIMYHEVDEDKKPTPGITGYPTIIMIDERGVAHKYSSAPDFAQLRAWVVAPYHFD